MRRLVLSGAIAAPLILFIPQLSDPMSVKWLAFYLLLGVLIWQADIRSIDRLDIAVLALIAWVAGTLLWAPDFLAGAQRAWNFAAGMTAFLLLRRIPLLENQSAVIGASIAVLIALLFLEQYAGYGNRNFLAETILIASPFLLTRRYLWPVLLAAGVYILFFNASKMEYIVLGALLLFLLIGVGRRGISEGASAGIAFICLSGGFLLSLFNSDMRDSVLHRVELWISTLAAWKDAPLFGQGASSFNYLYGKYADAELAIWPHKGLTVMVEERVYPGSAHNEIFQFVMETGLVGLALLFAVILIASRHLTTIRAHRLLGGSVLVIAGLLSLVSSPLQHPPTVLLVAIAAAMLFPANGWRIPDYAGKAISLALFFGTGWLVLAGLLWLSSQWHLLAMNAYYHTNPMYALQANFRAYETYPYDGHPRIQLIRSMARVMDIAVPEKKTAENIYLIARSAAPYHAGVLTMRLYYLMKTGCTEECDEIADFLRTHASRVNDTRKMLRLYDGR